MVSLFAKGIAKSKASFTSNWGREGKYWIIFENGKTGNHATKKVEQVIFEGTVIRVVDPGPPAGQRWKPTKGGNEGPHAEGEPYTFYFEAGQLGSEGRAKRLILVATCTDESKLVPVINPATGAPVGVPEGTAIDPRTGAPVNPGTPGAVIAIDPIELALEQALSPVTNAFKDIIIEVAGRGTNTQGRGAGGVKQAIIAIDPVRRVWGEEVMSVWESLGNISKGILQKDKRIEGILAREAREKKLLQEAS